MIMKKLNESMNGRIKKTVFCILTAFLSLFFVLTSPVAAFAGEQRVFDNGGLLEPEEREELEKKLTSFREEWQMDLGILTVSEAGRKTTEQIADDFYDEQGMGVGQSYSGALFVIDMDNREIYISTLGEMGHFLTDERIESVLDDAYPYVSAGDYKGCAGAAVDGISHYMRAEIPAGQYDDIREDYHPSLRPSEILFALIVSAVVALIPCVRTVSSYKMKKEQKLAVNSVLSYRENRAFSLQQTNDIFVNKSVTQRRIPQSTGSTKSVGSTKSTPSRRSSGSSAGRTTLHRSSSKRMHGGGGRKF